MKEQNIKYLIFDAETGPDIRLAKLVDENDHGVKILPDSPMLYNDYKSEQIKEGFQKIYKKNYANQATIDKHKIEVCENNYQAEYNIMVQSYKEKIQKLALHHPFAYIKLARLIIVNGEKKENLIWENEGNNSKTEREIIEIVCDKIYDNMIGSSGTDTHELVTFNGKHFDILLLIERGGVLNANIQYRWLERLTQRGDRFGHYDMMEHRAYMNTPVNKLSLSKNLIIRFGKEFAKKEIDFANCSMDKLKDYNLDENLKFEYWFRKHSGYPVLPVEEFLKSLETKDAEKSLPEIEITIDDLPS